MGRKRHIILSCFKPALNLKIRLRGLDRLKGIKIFLNMVKKDQLCAIALMKRRSFSLGFAQNDCYGNQPHPFEGLIKALIALAPAVPALR